MALSRKVEDAKRAIETVNGDTSVSPEDTYDALDELRDYITEMLQALKDDGVKPEWKR